MLLYLLLWRLSSCLVNPSTCTMVKEKVRMTKQRDNFRRALEQSRKGESLDLSEEDFELFSAIQNDGIIKVQQKKLDTVEVRRKVKDRLSGYGCPDSCLDNECEFFISLLQCITRG